MHSRTRLGIWYNNTEGPRKALGRPSIDLNLTPLFMVQVMNMSANAAAKPVKADTKAKKDEWITVKLRLRPHVVAALHLAAEQESQNTGRRVYATDLLRDALKAYCTTHNIDIKKKNSSRQP